MITYDSAVDTIYPAIEINNCELSIVCVPTPKEKDGSCNISVVESVISAIESPLILFADNRRLSGKCLPKDLSAIIQSFTQQRYELKAIKEFNDNIRMGDS